MKKIIYSLVAMLFMGSVFTSCIPQTEPDGVREMRIAHAEYLRALADLVTANEAVAAAEANFLNAKAAVKQAIAAQEQANARAIELANELTAAQNEQAIANILDQMEQDRVNNEAALLAAKAALAQAQKDFEDALNAIEIESLAMSDEEAAALAAIKNQYDIATANLRNWYENYQAEMEVVYDTYYYYLLLQAIGYGDDDLADYIWYSDFVDIYYADNQADWVAERLLIDQYELDSKKAEAEFWKGLLNDMEFDFLAEAEAYEKEAEAMAPEFAQVLRDSVLFENEYGTARDRAINAANDAYDEAKDGPKKAYDDAVKALKDANKNWKKQVTEPADIDAANAAWKAVAGSFSFKKGYALPDHSAMAPDLVEAYKTQLGFNGFAGNVTFKNDSLFVEIAAQKDSAAYATVVDTIWNGNQSTQELLKQKTGLWSVYEDFSRDLLFEISKKGIEADADAIKAYADKLRAEYDSILNILKSAKDGQGAALVDAWQKKVKAAADNIDKLQKKVDEFEDYEKKAENNIYTVKDAVNGYDGAAPRVIYKYANNGARKIVRDEGDPTHFELSAADPKWFDADPTNPMSIVLARTDSAEFINAVKAYFEAVASINEKAVPYLKFITADKDGNFKVDSVRADKVELAGLQMKTSNTYLESRGIHKVATYDNKAINDISVPPTDAKNYVDALTNLINLYNHYVHGEALLLPFYTAADDAYTAGTSGVAAYAAYVNDFKADNTGATLDKYHKVFDAYTADDFKKYTQMSDEGKAVANWMDACEKYFGVEGLAGVGEKVYFTYDTFTDPTWVVVFKGVPAYTKDDKGKVTSVTPAAIESTTYQYQFVEKAIMDNLGANSAYATADMPTKSLVFKLLAADYLYLLATNTDSINAIWEALGELLKQVKADMDAVDEAADKTTAANKALAAKFNEALTTYKNATKALKDTRDAAIKEANDTYDAAKKEILDPISEKYVELRNKYNDLMNLAEGLEGAYATLWAGGAPDTDALLEYLYKKYTDALEAIDWDEYYIAQLKVLAGLITIEDPTLDEIAEVIDLIQEILDEMDWDKYYDLEFWYEYWKAAYEAAVARYAE